jgi:hypothetical protein
MLMCEGEQRAVRQARRWHAEIDARCLSREVVCQVLYRRCWSVNVSVM